MAFLETFMLMELEFEIAKCDDHLPPVAQHLPDEDAFARRGTKSLEGSAVGGPGCGSSETTRMRTPSARTFWAGWESGSTTTAAQRDGYRCDRALQSLAREALETGKVLGLF